MNKLIQKNTCIPAAAVLFTVAKMWKEPVFISKWMDEEDVV